MISHLLGTVASSILLSGPIDYTPFVTWGTYFQMPEDALAGATPVRGIVNGPTPDTSVFKFGTKSLKVNAGEDAIALASPSSLFDFGTGNFTIEFWIRGSTPPTGDGTVSFMAHYRPSGGDRCWRIIYNPSSRNFSFGTSTNGTAEVFAIYNFASSGAANTFFNGTTWRHVAAVRNGATTTIYLDGVAGATTGSMSTSPVFYQTTWLPTIGGTPSINSSDQAFIGNYDEIRVTKGLARYTSGFTPPTTQFGRNSTDDPNISNVILLMDFETANWGVTQYGSIGAQTFTWTFAGITPMILDGGFAVLSASTSIASIPANSAHDLGSGDFTIEGYISGRGVAGGPLFGPYDTIDGKRGWEVDKNGTTNYRFLWTTDGLAATAATIVICTHAEMGTSGVLRHFAVTRSGATLRTYLDGVLKNTGTLSGAIFDPTSFPTPFYFGARRNGTGIINNPPDASTKALRITKGAARYTGSSFTPPSLASFLTLA